MPFAPTSIALILKHKAYNVREGEFTSVDLRTLIVEQMTGVEATWPEMIPVIEADLAQLETLDATLTTEQGNTNSTLIQAGPLRWSDRGSKTSAIEDRYEEIRLRVSRLLARAIVDDYDGRGMSALGRG